MSEVVSLEARVNGINNIRDLKTALKDAKNELLQFEVGTKAFDDAQKKVSLLKDKLGDLGDSARIAGTPSERLGQSFGLMGEALRGADLDKAKLAFTGIGQAMSAIPIFLLIEGLTYLVQNFEKVVEVYNNLVGTTNEAERAIRKQNDALREQKFLVDELAISYKYFEQQRTKELALELERLKQIGASENTIRETTIKSEEKKLAELKVLRDKANELGLNQTEAMNAVFEQMDKIDILKAQDKTQDLLEIEERKKKRAVEIHKEMLTEKKVLDEQDVLARKAAQQEFDDIFKQLEAEANENDLTAYLDFEWQKMLGSIDIEKKGAKQKKEIDAQTTAEKAKQAAIRTKLESESFNAAKGLSEAFFAIQLSRAKGNEAEELKIKKRAFEVDKAFNVARAVQDGIRSVQGVLAQSSIYGPATIPISIAMGATAAANVAKILATQFNGAQAVTPSDSGQSFSGGVPSLPTPQTRQGSTLLDDFGNPISGQQRDEQVIRAYLLDKEVEGKMKNLKRIEEQSKF